MKTILFISILLCIIALPALGELTDADLDKIRLIVNESETRFIEKVDGKIKDSENRMKQYIDLKIEGVNGRIAGIEGRFTGMEKQLATLTYLVYALIALVVLAVSFSFLPFKFLYRVGFCPYDVHMNSQRGYS